MTPSAHGEQEGDQAPVQYMDLRLGLMVKTRAENEQGIGDIGDISEEPYDYAMEITAGRITASPARKLACAWPKRLFFTG